jgi:hypothetical protein
VHQRSAGNLFVQCSLTKHQTDFYIAGDARPGAQTDDIEHSLPEETNDPGISCANAVPFCQGLTICIAVGADPRLE